MIERAGSVRHRHLGKVQGSATFSDDMVYRYALERAWDPSRPDFIVVGLNPSKATEWQDDPTMRRCIDFARTNGCGGFTMLNLYALRSTDPRKLRVAPDPVGPENDATIRRVLRRPGLLVLACGGNVMVPPRLPQVLAIAEGLNRAVWCLGKNGDGTPRHPLYLKASTPLERYA